MAKVFNLYLNGLEACPLAMERVNKSITIFMITRCGTQCDGSCCSIMLLNWHDSFGSIKPVFIYDYTGNLVIGIETSSDDPIINLPD